MKFGIFGLRHYHIASAAAELLSLGWECIGVCETKGPQVGRIVKEYGFKVISGSEEFFAEKPEYGPLRSGKQRKDRYHRAVRRKGRQYHAR
jgi:hypothetical protein